MSTGSPAAANPPAEPLLGFHIGRGDALHLEAARAAGGGFVVVVFSWADIEPEPNYLYWEVPDAALRAARFYGLEVVARLDRPPEWARNEAGSEKVPWQLDAYANFARRVAERYGEQLAGVILWNEPNLSLEWADQPPDPTAYVELLKAAYPAVKAVSPQLPVLLAGLAFTLDDDQQAVNDLTYLQQLYAAGGQNYFDILAAHPYGFGRPPEDSPAENQLNFRRLELHRNLMVKNGDAGKPVWITEMGWRTSAPDPRDTWQVVNPAEQSRYIQEALAWAGEQYPWLERLALWELNGHGDDYGYNLWHGLDQVSSAYKALVETCPQRSKICSGSVSSTTPRQSAIAILAADVAIRLGDRGTLHPHWVHLHRGGQNFSPDWQGEFFLQPEQARQPYDLLLETMQVDQPTNRLSINGVEVARLRPRTRPDPTSTWVTQHFSLPANLLRPGRNTLSLTSGQRNPARQYGFWRWENFQFRNVRLVPPSPDLSGLAWTPQASPSGWSDINRLHPGLNDDFWLTGNGPGQIWRGLRTAGAAKASLQNQSGSRPDLVFGDVLPLVEGELAATALGLYWRAGGGDWQPVAGAPEEYAYVVSRARERFYAGFEEGGIWSAAQPAGPWQQDGLTGLTVLDLVYHRASNHLFAATDKGIFVHSGAKFGWASLPELPGAAQNSLQKFITRLYLGQQGELVARSLDRLWLYPATAKGDWQPFGPAELNAANKLYTVLDCCGPGAVVSSNFSGLWQLTASGEWQRFDRGDFETVDAIELLRLGGDLYAGGFVGLFQSTDEGKAWEKVEGLPPAITDLLIDPLESNRWLAATPAGLYRSEDGGRTWQVISPPWTVWDLAIGLTGRLFVARTNGLAWTDDWSAGSVAWQAAAGLEDVLFFRANPHPTNPSIVWAGTWGNDTGVSDDGGREVASLGNGLETLSVLDVLWHPTPGQITAATIEGLYRSDDAGQSWFKLPGPLTRQTVYALLQTDDSAVWAGAADGLWLSRDYGVTWEQANGMPSATVIRLGRLADLLWAGTEDAGLWLSNDNGMTWRFAGLAGRSIYHLLADPLQPGRWVAATDQGIWTALVPSDKAN